VVFQPLSAGKVTRPYVLFADGFAGASKEPGRAAFRPTGLAAGPDGALYIADDSHGRIWRVTYQGPGLATVAAAKAVPTADEMHSSPAAGPPEGVHPDAGEHPAELAPPPGVSAEQLALGDKIFHGRAHRGACAGCHGSGGKGSGVGADLTAGKWLWGDGSLASLSKTIAEGVATPKQHMGAMPPMGGSMLSASDLQAVSAYVWAIGHSTRH
jgi:mono/diheme cytochrome c family protein